MNSDAAINEAKSFYWAWSLWLLASIHRRYLLSDIEFADRYWKAKLVVDLGLTTLAIELDSANVINLISERIISNLKIDRLIFDITNQLTYI